MIWILVAFYARRSAYYTHAHSIQECPLLESEEKAQDQSPTVAQTELPAAPDHVSIRHPVSGNRLGRVKEKLRPKTSSRGALVDGDTARPARTRAPL